MKSLFFLMLALAIPFWSLSRSSVQTSTELIEQAHWAHAVARFAPQPGTTPTPATASPRETDAAALPQLPFTLQGLAQQPWAFAAACPNGLASAHIERHDPVVAVADALLEAPGEESLVDWRPRDLAARTDWMPCEPRAERQTAPGTVRNALAVSLGSFARLEARLELAKLGDRVQREWPAWSQAAGQLLAQAAEAGAVQRETACAACRAGTWWQAVERRDALLRQLSGEGFEDFPVADAEATRLFRHWLEAGHAECRALGQAAARQLASSWLRSLGRRVGQLASHTGVWHAALIAAEVDENHVWVEDVQTAETPRAGHPSDWRQRGEQVLKQAAVACDVLAQQFRALSRRVRGQSQTHRDYSARGASDETTTY